MQEGFWPEGSGCATGGQHSAALGSHARPCGDCELPAAERRGPHHPQQAGQAAHRPVPALLEQRLPLHARGPCCLTSAHSQF